MQSDTAGTARLHFASEGWSPRTDHSVGFHVQPGGFHDYAVDLPVRNSELLHVRFVPIDRAEATIDLVSLRFESFKGIHTVVHEAIPKHVDLPDHAQVVRISEYGITLRSLTAEPGLVLQVRTLDSYRMWRVAVAAIALLALGGIAVAGGLRIGSETDAMRVLIYAIAFFAVGLQAFYYAQKLLPGSTPDERAHSSYVMHLKQEGSICPDRKNWREFDYTDGRVLEKFNYLAHPALFYNLLKPFTPERPTWAMQHLTRLRHVSLLMAMAGVGLFFWIASRYPLPLVCHAYIAAAIACVPTLPYLAGGVSNDNLLLLGGGIAMWGGLAFLCERPHPHGLPCLGAGLALAMLTKATAGLQVGFFCVLVMVIRVRRDRSLKAFTLGGLFSFTVLCVGPMALYLWYHQRYGTFTPTLHPLSVRPIRLVPTMDMTTYLAHFARTLTQNWVGIFSHRSVFKRSVLEALPMLAPLALAGLGFFWIERDRLLPERTRRFFDVCRLATAATVLLLLVHVLQRYQVYARSGYPGGIQARYYFAMMPCVLMLSARPFVGSSAKLLTVLIVAGMILGFMASSLWYYLLFAT